jgi:hypothetical protein
VAVSDRNTRSAKKAFYDQQRPTLFLLHLGCLLLESTLTPFGCLLIFSEESFRKLFSKNKHFSLAFFQKNRAHH